MNLSEAGRRAKSALKFALPALTLLVVQSLSAQVKAADLKSVEPKSASQSYQTLYLSGTTREHDGIELVTDLRNMLPYAKLFYVPSQNAISMFGSADDFAVARKMLADLDKAKRAYRLTYSITEMDGGQAVGTRQIALIVIPGENASLKQGSRVPIVTGTAQGGASNENTVEYLDVGLKIEASLDGPPDGLRLRTKVEQSSLADEKSGLGGQDPVIRQTALDATSTLAQNKPLVLGTLDIPGSGRREQIQVSSELIQ